MSDVSRFWAKVEKGPGCWIWTAARRNGYGRFKVGPRKVTAHRFSWALVHGEPPAHLDVCHRCDNPPCVRPEHLFLGTRSENCLDMTSKGRRRSYAGQGNPNSKLSAAQVEELRALYAGGGWYQYELAERFGVTQAQVSAIWRRKEWAA